MKKIILIFALSFCFIDLQCQTNKTQGTIHLTVLNGSFITSIDTVYLRLVGSLYQLGGIMSKSYDVTGSIISASVNGCSSGLSTMTPVDEIIKILPISQGTYKIKARLIEYDNFITPNCNMIKANTSDSLNINVVTYTAINENYNALNKIRIYPNPAKNKILIDVANLNLEKTNISIYNSLGQCVLLIEDIKSNQEVELTNLVTGLYYITIQKDSYKKTSKLFKE